MEQFYNFLNTAGREEKCRAKLLKTFAIVGELIDCDLRESFEKKIYLSSTFGAINKNFPRFEGEIRENWTKFLTDTNILFSLHLLSAKLSDTERSRHAMMRQHSWHPIAEIPRWMISSFSFHEQPQHSTKQVISFLALFTPLSKPVSLKPRQEQELKSSSISPKKFSESKSS